jgi:predicted nucleic acid-binding Zn ribbon protein
MPKERDLLFDLGYINVNYALGIDTIFMRDNDIFSTPITENNKVILKGEDMYNCGYWLEKQKMGTFICKNCGKEFAHYTKSKQEKGRKYCKECADILSRRIKEKKDIPAPEGYRYCEECGELFELKSLKDFTSTRCPECQAEVRREKVRENLKRYRSKCNQSCDS